MGTKYGLQTRQLDTGETVLEAKLTLTKWVMISIDQCVTITADGVSSRGAPVSELVLEKHRLTAQDLQSCLRSAGDVVIPRAVLEQLKAGSLFNVSVTVNFDAGGTWSALPNLLRLPPTLVA